MSNLAKLRLILDVDIDPQGEPIKRLKLNLHRVVQDATNNGTLTGDSPATVEHYSFKVIERRPRKRSVKTCKKCGSPLDKHGHCTDRTCPYSDRKQTDTFTVG